LALAALLLVPSVMLHAENASPAPAIFQERMEQKNTAAKPLRILCVGDSITAGYTDNPNWDVPFEFGYRQGLFERLQKSGYQFQFVGDSPEPWDGRFGVPKNSPSPDLRVIGQDRHEGHGGWNTAQVLQHIDQWITKSQPDFVLLMIGINDAGRPPAAENLKGIVEKIVAVRPQAHVVVAQITPLLAFTQSIADYNTSIRDTLVPEFQRRGYKVTTVDQYRNMLKTRRHDRPRAFLEQNQPPQRHRLRPHGANLVRRDPSHSSRSEELNFQ
jgi:lysophospholipase L1-like esterase